MLQDWYYFTITGGKPFKGSESDNGEPQVEIAEPKNLVSANALLILCEVEEEDPNNSNLNEPLSKMPHKQITCDEETVFFNETTKSFYAKIYGYVGVVAQTLKVVPPIILVKKKTEAHFYFNSEIPEPKPTYDVIRDLLALYNYVPSVSSDQIENQLPELQKGKRTFMLISKGRMPQNGWPEWIEITLDYEKKAGKLKDDGSIDFKDRQAITEVQKGAPVGYFHDAMPTLEGFDVFGTKMEAKETIKGPRIGENLIRDESDPTIVISNANGYISVEKNTVEIIETLVINSDVNYEVGNIEFFGNVEIMGRVLTGFSVNAFGTLKIHGGIEGANVFSSGNMEVLGGIVGKEGTKVQSSANISTLYLQNAEVHAEGDIVVEDFIYHSKVFANESTYCTNKRGVVVGGLIVAKRLIEVNVAGNKDEALTLIVCGVDLLFDAKIERKEKEIEHFIERKELFIKKTGAAFGAMFFRNPKLVLDRLDDKKKQQAIKVIQELQKLNQYIKTAEAELETGRKKGPVFDFEPKIIIHNQKYEGVKAKIPSDHLLNLDELYN